MRNGKKILGTLVLVLVAVYVLGTGVWDLMNVAGRCEVTVSDAAQMLEVQHSMNGLIPLGKDYYYVALEDNTDNIYVIQAPKHWLGAGIPEGETRTVKGLVKSYDRFQTQRKIEEELSILTGVNYPIGTAKYLKLGYAADAWMKIIGVLVLAGVVGLFAYFSISGKDTPAWVRIMLFALMFGALVVVLLAMV